LCSQSPLEKSGGATGIYYGKLQPGTWFAREIILKELQALSLIRNRENLDKTEAMREENAAAAPALSDSKHEDGTLGAPLIHFVVQVQSASKSVKSFF